MPFGSTTTIFASTTESNGTISQVNFTSSDTGKATVTSPDTSSPYTSVVTGVSVGSATVTAEGIMAGTPRCSATAPVNVTQPGPWWQVKDADVIVSGVLASLIPPTCTTDCFFSLKGPGGFPGIPIYGETFDFASGTDDGRGKAGESPNWLAQTTYQGKIYDYTYFKKLIPDSVTINEIEPNGVPTTVNQGYFSSQGSSSPRSFYWFHHKGDLTLNGEPALKERKVILLVEEGDLYINGRINLTAGRGFFMAIVGTDTHKFKGNIIVDPSVSHPTQPSLEGLFLADKKFKTGAGDKPLRVRGSIAAWDKLALERDLGSDNQTTPTVVVEYAPDLVFTFPREFSRRRMTWREVAP